MLSQELRRDFLNYFKKHGHRVISSSPVVPFDDPTILFTNAGMNQFKDVFLEKSIRDYKNATTVQKCIRVGGKHNDLENVGHTNRHLTFFEMLGNFSFGDYFKEKAISFAWDVTVNVFQFDPKYLWVSVFREDDEAFELWKKYLPESRIVRLNEKDNFWSMGETGPCGPCSELYYDRGPTYGSLSFLESDGTSDRYLEFWNLVFIQLNRNASGQLIPLTKKSIDTGGGLERIALLKKGLSSVFQTDILKALIEEIEKISHRSYFDGSSDSTAAFHVIADHIRTLSFAIADGVKPSNLERGYVLRKVLRRAVRYGKTLGMHDPFLALLVPVLTQVMGQDYPELQKSQSYIEEILTLEEESFLKTLKRGGNLLQVVVQKAKDRTNRYIVGEEAFKLKDTYGLPLEEILLIAKDLNLNVDLEGYEELEKQAKERSKAGKIYQEGPEPDNIYQTFLQTNPGSQFIGYTSYSTEAIIKGLILNGKFITSVDPCQNIAILVDKTPFYPEKGGQVGDQGILEFQDHQALIIDCQNPYPGIILHQLSQLPFSLKAGDKVRLSINIPRRQLIQNHHTATHLLHWALIQLLGTHIRQAGSIVEESKLRFDFNHHKPVSEIEIQQIEDLVNEKVRENILVQSYELPYEVVQQRTDIQQLFGDKYEAVVRVVDIGPSKELCGGSHTSSTGTIGYFRIISEGSISAGVRRIEAVTGKLAETYVRNQQMQLNKQIEIESQKVKATEHLLKNAKKTIWKHLAHQMIQKAEQVGSFRLLTAIAPIEAGELGAFVEELCHQDPLLTLLIGWRYQDRCQVALKIPDALVKKGLNAAKILKETSPLISGSGGGRPELAQAGGKSPEHLEVLFQKIRDIICACQ